MENSDLRKLWWTCVNNLKVALLPGGGGALPYLGYTGCSADLGMVFWPHCPNQGIQGNFGITSQGTLTQNASMA